MLTDFKTLCYTWKIASSTSFLLLSKIFLIGLQWRYSRRGIHHKEKTKSKKVKTAVCNIFGDSNGWAEVWGTVTQTTLMPCSNCPEFQKLHFSVMKSCMSVPDSFRKRHATNLETKVQYDVQCYQHYEPFSLNKLINFCLQTFLDEWAIELFLCS